MHDTDLIERVRSGDREAFGILVTRHQKKVWLVCRQYLAPDEADEACQDSFVKAYTNITKFDERAAFTTWVTRIAINTCLDRLRKNRREGLRVESAANDDRSVLDVVPDSGAGPDRRAEQRQAIGAIRRLETGLPERQREIFRLRFYAEMDLDQIAESLGVHIGTVKTQLHRAVHRLRREMGDLR